MLSVRTSGPDDTRALAGAVAGLTSPGDVILLAGDLGAGKTTFTQGLGEALGVEDRITSPTFTIASQHEGRVRLHHLDVYRLDDLQETADLGLEELLDDSAVVVVEWGDRIAPVLPADFLEIRLTFPSDGGDDDRELALRPVGTAWRSRSRLLGEALDRWTTRGATT